MTGESIEKGRWSETMALLGDRRVNLGPYFSYQLLNTPRRILFALSYHKFAAKLIGKNQRVLEVGCSEGLGTLLLAEFCKFCLGIDIDEASIQFAQENFTKTNLEFKCVDILSGKLGDFDAVTSFDVIEHIFPQNEENFLKALVENLSTEGMCVIGTPNINSDQYASPVTRSGHVNLYSAERLEQSLSRHFRKVMIFSANDEVVHTGFTPMAHYLMGVGIGLIKK